MEKNKNKQIGYIVLGIIIIVIIIFLLVFNKDKNYKLTMYVDGEKYKSNTVEKNDKTSLPDAPKKKGYTFVGWYNNGKKIDENTKITKDLKLTAKYAKKTYTVTFNNGFGDKNDVKVKYKDKVDVPKNPSRENYAFAGWYLGNKKFNFNTKITANIELIARWNEVNNTTQATTGLKGNSNNYKEKTTTNEIPKTVAYYTVEHYLGQKDGSYDEKPYEIEKLEGYAGDSVTPATKKYRGYTSPSTQSVVINSDGSTIVKYYYPVGKYTITVTGDNGIEKTEGTGIYYIDELVHVTATVKEGYTFNKWSTGEKELSFAYKVDDYSTTIEALTTPIPYDISYTLNGGTLKNPKNSYTIEDDFDLGKPNKVGYDFTGWLVNGEPSDGKIHKGNMGNIKAEAQYAPRNDTNYIIRHCKQGLDLNYNECQDEPRTGTTDTEADAPVQHYEGFTSPEKKTDVNIDADGSTVITYKYERNKYLLTISYTDVETPYNNDSSVKDITKTDNFYYGSSVSVKIELNEGYELEKWSNDDTNNPTTYVMTSDKNQTLTAFVKRRSYKVEFDSKEGTPVDSETAVYGHKVTKPNNPTRDCYEFIGWYYEDSEGQEKEWDFENDVMPHQEITLYAKWKLTKNTVAFEANGGSFKDSTDELIVPKQEIGKPIGEPSEQPTKVGYTFVGWYKDKQGNKKWDFQTDEMPEDGLYLYAKWEANTYTVEYDSNKGNGSSTPIGDVKPTTHTYDQVTDLSTEQYSRDGYTFLGWSKTEYRNSVDKCDDCITTASNLTDQKDGSITLYAVWKANTYTVNYDSNQGKGSIKPTGEVKSTSHTYDVKSSLTDKQYSREGYEFLGWSKDANSNALVTDADNLATEGNITLYAVWEINNYTITLDPKDGQLDAESEMKYTVEDEEELPTPTKAGYTFAGWYAKDTQRKIDKIEPGMTGNLELEARWTGIPYTVVYKDDDREIAKETFTYGSSHTIKGSDTLTKEYTITYDENGGSDVSDNTVTATLKSWKVKDSDETYLAGATVADLIIPTTDNQTVILVPDDYNYPTVQLPQTTKNTDADSYLTYEFDGWYKDDSTKQEGTITVKESMNLKAHYKNTIDTDKFINDCINDDGYISSTLTGTSISSNIIKVNEKTTTVLTETGNYVNFIKKLLETEGVKSITLKYNDKDYILNNNNVYNQLRDLVKEMTSTSKEGTVDNRKLSSLYNKEFTIQIVLNDNAKIKNKSTNSITYTTKFSSNYIISKEYWTKLGNSVMQKINNNYNLGKYRIIAPSNLEDQIPTIYMEYFPSADNSRLEDGAFGAGFKTALKNLLGDTDKSDGIEYPLTAIKTLTLTYNGRSISATEENVKGYNWESFLLDNFTGDLEALTTKRNSDLLNEQVQIKLEIDTTKWAFADDFTTPLEYVLRFRKGGQQ